MMKDFQKIDDIDRKILYILKENSKEKLVNISKKLGLPVSTIYNRIKKLEESGVIKRYSVEIDYSKLGYGVKSVILIKYDPLSKNTQEELLDTLLKMEPVEKGFIITGEWDLMIICRFRNIDEMSKFILNKLRNIDGVKETYTLIILKEK